MPGPARRGAVGHPSTLSDLPEVGPPGVIVP